MVTFGAEVEVDLDGIEGRDSKKVEMQRQMRLNRWLGIEQKFRDPLSK